MELLSLASRKGLINDIPLRQKHFIGPGHHIKKGVKSLRLTLFFIARIVTVFGTTGQTPLQENTVYDSIKER